MIQPSARPNATLRARIDERPDAVADPVHAIAPRRAWRNARDMIVFARDADHSDAIVDVVKALGASTLKPSPIGTFLLHLGGEIEVNSNAALTMMIYARPTRSGAAAWVA